MNLPNIYATPEMVQKFITDLGSFKAFGPDCIQVIVIKNFVREL